MSEAKTSKLGTAVVTGASSGIGKVFADRLAARGYDLLLVARRADRLTSIAAELESRYPVRVQPLAADLVDPATLAEVATTIATDAAITMLVNNAGTSAVGPITEIPLETITSMIALNITALTTLTRAVLPRFLAGNAGTIINVGSVVGFAAYPWVPVYGGTKAYVQNFTQGLQQQLAETNLRIQLVTPAATVSEIWDTFGMPLSSLPPEVVMTTEDCVDAALKGLDLGEPVSAPSVHDEALLRKYEEAAAALFLATQTGKPAPRYGVRA